mgnify:CR=1 FL=1
MERKKKVLFSVVDLGNTMKFRDLSSCSADYDSWIVNAANCYANLGYDIQCVDSQPLSMMMWRLPYQSSPCAGVDST